MRKKEQTMIKLKREVRREEREKASVSECQRGGERKETGVKRTGKQASRQAGKQARKKEAGGE